MEHELTLGNLHGEDVIGNPLIEQVVLAFVVLVGCKVVVVAILMVVENPLREFLEQVGASRIYALLAPEVIGFGKDGEAIQTMFGSITYFAFRKAVAACHAYQVGNLSCLVEFLVFFVAYRSQRVEQSASLNDAEASEEAVPLFVEGLLDVAGCRYVFWSDDFFNLMDDAVDGKDVAFLYTDGTILVDVDAVGFVGGFPYGKLLVVEASEDKLVLVLRELCSVEEGICLVSAVDDTVVDDDFSDGVGLVFAWESVPRWLAYESVLNKILQILLYRVVGWSKDSVNASSAQELAYLRIAKFADVHLPQDIYITAIDIVLLQITQDGVIPEDVSGRSIDSFLATPETRNQKAQFEYV